MADNPNPSFKTPTTSGGSRPTSGRSAVPAGTASSTGKSWGRRIWEWNPFDPTWEPIAGWRPFEANIDRIKRELAAKPIPEGTVIAGPLFTPNEVGVILGDVANSAKAAVPIAKAVVWLSLQLLTAGGGSAAAILKEAIGRQATTAAAGFTARAMAVGAAQEAVKAALIKAATTVASEYVKRLAAKRDVQFMPLLEEFGETATIELLLHITVKRAFRGLKLDLKDTSVALKNEFYEKLMITGRIPVKLGLKRALSAGAMQAVKRLESIGQNAAKEILVRIGQVITGEADSLNK